MSKQKLELTWVGKEEQPRLEPRILLEDPEKSYHAKFRVSDNDIFDNRLIFGDNLLALKALEQEFTGKVKCIYIDPPFNTKQAFEYYDDGVEHSVWLSLLRDRINLLHSLLSPDGSLFIHIDDNELAYLTVLVDEIFGRENRISIITFKQSSASGPKAINPGIVTTTNFLLYYVKDKRQWNPNRVFVSAPRDDRYSKFIINFESGYEDWKLINLKDAFLQYEQLKTWNAAKQKYLDKLEEKITQFVVNNSEKVVRTARVAPKDVNENARQTLQLSVNNPGKVYRSLREDKDDYFFYNGEQLVFYKAKTKIIDSKITTASPLTNMWDDLLSNNLHNEGGVSFPNGKKPEALVKRVIELSTNPGDLVLDSFAGSGTTGAVAHKMGRRWIMIELGEHCHTHIIPRLQKVIDGADQGGISKAVNWQGGGGFRYYKLAPSLLQKDKYGNWIISKEYNAEMLAEAMCKHEGFTYAPNETVFWKQGQSTENDFIYTTTVPVTAALLETIADQMGGRETLLICCTAFLCREEDYPQITLKRIPAAVLARCEFGRDDYSLQVSQLEYQAETGQTELWGGEDE